MNDEEWFDPYRLGVPMIDADHLSLFKEVHKFEKEMRAGLSDAQLSESLDFLYRYVGTHFIREEQLMREKNYPRYFEHKSLHHHLKKVVFAIRKIFQTDPRRVDHDKLHAFLKHWLQEHIINVDMKLVPCVTSESTDTAAPPQPAEISLAPSEELVEVTVKVPRNKVPVIERCAYVLQHSTPEAEDLEELATSATGLTLEEALELARPVLIGSQ